MGKIERTKLTAKLRQIAERVKRKAEQWSLKKLWKVFVFCAAIAVSVSISALLIFLALKLKTPTDYVPLAIVATIVFLGSFPLARDLVEVFLLHWLRPLPLFVRQLGSHYELQRREALKQLLKMGEKSIPLFLQALQALEDSAPYSDWNGAWAHQYAIEGLGRLKAREAIDEVSKALKSSNASIRATAAWFFGELGIKEAIPELIPLLADEKVCCVLCGSNKEWVTSVNHIAAEALRKLGEGELVDDFKSVLERERDEEALERLKRWLPQYRHAIVRGLINALQGSNVFNASQAAWALGKLNAVEALPVLERLAKSSRTPHMLRQVCREVVPWLRLIATLPSPADLTSIRTENLPAIPDPNAIPTDTLPRPATAPKEDSEMQKH